MQYNPKNTVYLAFLGLGILVAIDIVITLMSGARPITDITNVQTMLLEIGLGVFLALLILALQQQQQGKSEELIKEQLRLSSKVNDIISKQEVINRKLRLNSLGLIKDWLGHVHENLRSADDSLVQLRNDMNNTDNILARNEIETSIISVVRGYYTTVKSYVDFIRSVSDGISHITDPDLITKIRTASRIALTTFENVGNTEAQLQVTMELLPTSKQRVSDALIAVETELEKLNRIS
ncbi:MAG: hypothetical protein HMLIMOIP_002335 [Candidatus Nitrosomirales archaeon]|jgi:hypothetical protein